jgi:uncharacterized protein YneR
MISIDDKAFKWFEKEFQSAKPFSIRLYPQYAGQGEKKTKALASLSHWKTPQFAVNSKKGKESLFM